MRSWKAQRPTNEELPSIKFNEASFLNLFYSVLVFQLINSVFQNLINAPLKGFFKLWQKAKKKYLIEYEYYVHSQQKPSETYSVQPKA